MEKELAPSFCAEIFSQNYKFMKRVLLYAGLSCIWVNMVTKTPWTTGLFEKPL